MRTKTIGVRELQHQFKKVTEAAKRGASFVVTSHRKPLFRIEPVTMEDKKIGKTLLKEIKPLMYRSGKKDLSKKINKMTYGDRR